jgi:hypothetical protein
VITVKKSHGNGIKFRKMPQLACWALWACVFLSLCFVSQTSRSDDGDVSLGMEDNLRLSREEAADHKEASTVINKQLYQLKRRSVRSVTNSSNSENNTGSGSVEGSVIHQNITLKLSSPVLRIFTAPSIQTGETAASESTILPPTLIPHIILRRTPPWARNQLW